MLFVSIKGREQQRCECGKVSALLLQALCGSLHCRYRDGAWGRAVETRAFGSTVKIRTFYLPPSIGERPIKV